MADLTPTISEIKRATSVNQPRRIELVFEAMREFISFPLVKCWHSEYTRRKNLYSQQNASEYLIKQLEAYR